MFDDDYTLESGPQRRGEEPEAFRKVLDEKCPDPTTTKGTNE